MSDREVNMTKKCDTCCGSGRKSESRVCVKCSGYGYITEVVTLRYFNLKAAQ